MTTLLAFQWGFWEILIVLMVFLLLFGSTKLPQLARSLGLSMTEFKKGLRGEADEDASDAKKLDDAQKADEATAKKAD